MQPLSRIFRSSVVAACTLVALGQVAAFNLANPIPLFNLKKAMNRLLPSAIRVLDAEEAAHDFHPRFEAQSKTYRYTLYRGETCPPFERP